MNRIKNLFGALGDKMQSWLYGRYGYDELNRFLNLTALVLIFLSIITATSQAEVSYLLSAVAVTMYLISMFRTYSRNLSKRQLEREKYLRLTETVRAWGRLQKNRFADRKTHRYFKCKQCKTVLRVPRGKGKIKICCRICGAELVKKT